MLWQAIWLMVHLLLGSEVGGHQGYCFPCSCQWDTDGYMQMDCINTGLTYIPKPRSSERKAFKLSVFYVGNNIPILTTEILSNITVGFRLYYLSLRNNGIRNMTPDVFSRLKYVRRLDISENNVAKTDLQKAFSGLRNLTSLRLNISSMGLKQPFDSLFHCLKDNQDISITMRNNSLTSFPFEAIKNLNVHYLDVSRNDIFELNFTGNFTYLPLTQLILDDNKIPAFPDFCKNNKSHFPRLSEMSIKFNKMSGVNRERYKCLRSINRLYLDGNPIEPFKQNEFADLPNLFLVSLSYTGCVMRKTEGYVFNNSALETIYFTRNHLWFRTGEVNLTMFHGCTSLKQLNISDNIFQLTKESEFDTIFKDLKSLETLVIGRGGLYVIPKTITRDLVNLTYLALFENSIHEINDGQLENLTKLEKFFMGGNKISVITEKTFPRRFLQNVREIDFSQNPFSCTCDLLWFVNWMKSNLHKFDKAFIYNHTCAGPANVAGIPLLNLTLSDHECLLGLNEKVITLTASVVLMILLVVGSVLYRYRWHIRYFIYMIRYRQRQEVDTRYYDYDAFVAYSTDDREWVIKWLLPVLEDRENLKLCVHDRDFVPGRLIVDNIVDGIEKSRKVIIVLSNNFAQSDWCQFELNLIQRHVLEHGQHLLVVVILEEIDTCHVTKAMRAMLQTTTYLLWGEEDYAKKAFFNRLRMLLKTSRHNGKERRLSV